MSWITDSGPMRDVVMSSRVRLARNIAGLPFPIIMDKETARETMKKVYNGIMNSNSALVNRLKFIPMYELDPVERNILVEKHLVSSELIQRADYTGIIIDDKEEICIMLNEEDHIRFQCILAGNQIEEAWDIIDKVDDVMEENIEYSYHETLGYLTSCPTNVGTGMRASVMMHLPALVYGGHINGILQTISKIGLTARGLYGEGSEALGHIFQISNQVTLGPTEKEIVANLQIVVKQIAEKEKLTRKAVHEANGIEFEDNVYRSLGILKYAKKLNIKEFMALLSQVRLGVSMGIIEDISLTDIDRVMIIGQSANLHSYAEKHNKLGTDLDIVRAEVVERLI